MRILGIDPGSHQTGWAVLERCGLRLQLIAADTVRLRGQLPKRLMTLAHALHKIISAHQPEQAAVESVFHAVNSQSALKLGHARGVVLCSLAQADIAVHEYAPTAVKKAATGHGRASKQQVQQMLCRLLGTQAPAGLDTSDAMAVALCHSLCCVGRG